MLMIIHTNSEFKNHLECTILLQICQFRKIKKTSAILSFTTRLLKVKKLCSAGEEKLHFMLCKSAAGFSALAEESVYIVLKALCVLTLEALTEGGNKLSADINL